MEGCRSNGGDLESDVRDGGLGMTVMSRGGEGSYGGELVGESGGGCDGFEKVIDV